MTDTYEARPVSRRGALKLLSAGALACGMPPRDVAAADVRQTMTLFDLSRCVGCGACVEACRERNAARYPKVAGPMPKLLPEGTPTEDWSQRQDETERLTPYNWLFIQHVEGEYQGKPFELHMPRRCFHCRQAPCALLCPWGAARKEASGTVRIDGEICLGGAKCRAVCPWHIPQRQSGVGLYLDLAPRLAGNGVMYKCDRCDDIVAAGGVPACVEICPEGVQSVGSPTEIIARARRMAQEGGGFLYGLEENGGTSTIYYSPVPFEIINAALRPEQGKPAFPPVPSFAASDDRLTEALLAAPVAGLLGGALRTTRRLARKARDELAVSSAPPENTELPPILRALLAGALLPLFFSGLLQLPIAARYGLTRLGAWLGDFALLHLVHYCAAAVWLGALGAALALSLRRRRILFRPVPAVLGAATTLTGALLALKNSGLLFFTPSLIVALDLIHLGAAFLLCGYAIFRLFRRRRNLPATTA